MCRSTFTDKTEYWQEDITGLNRQQLLLLVEAIAIIEQWNDGADYQYEDVLSDEILEKIPVVLLNHISAIDSPGRYLFLVRVAFALHTASLMAADLDSEYPWYSQPLANS